VAASAALALIVALKRLEGNRLPLPDGGRAKAVVYWRRLWLDRDVPLGQPWEEREQVPGRNQNASRDSAPSR
jgi:hypothetical protein